MPALMWFRRDLRLADNPAVAAATEDGPVLGVFILDDGIGDVGRARLDALHAALHSLHDATGGALVVRRGQPAEIIPALAREIGADRVHVTGEFTPYAVRRDERVRAAGVELVATGTPYAVPPGAVLKDDGTPYRVFTPYSRAWRDRGWPRPVETPEVDWITDVASDPVPESPLTLSPDAVAAKWQEFQDNDLSDYGSHRNRPDLDATSRLSIALKFGLVHPRTLLADLGRRRSDSATRFVTELCWREFYADVLHHQPQSAWSDLRPELDALEYDDIAEPEVADRFAAWQEGKTGYPIVDAGMRQLLSEGWMHNRVRMITASMLVKDLHVWWPHGARHFLRHLQDGDIASNNHGWQWVAGTGTDAAPYFRVFNPTLQGQKFDPAGDYVRRYIPELRHLEGKAVHEPWKAEDGYANGYPEPIIDHSDERKETLRRYSAAKDSA